MIIDPLLFIESLGNEPKEVLGYETKEQLEVDLYPLMQEIQQTNSNQFYPDKRTL